jgi:hypothetical protein
MVAASEATMVEAADALRATLSINARLLKQILLTLLN